MSRLIRRLHLLAAFPAFSAAEVRTDLKKLLSCISKQRMRTDYKKTAGLLARPLRKLLLRSRKLIRRTKLRTRLSKLTRPTNRLILRMLPACCRRQFISLHSEVHFVARRATRWILAPSMRTI